MRNKISLPRYLEIIIGVIVIVVLLGLLRFEETPKPGEPLRSLPVLRSSLRHQNVDLKKPVVDLSGYQAKANVDYKKLSDQIIGAVVRVQFGVKASAGPAVHADGSDAAFKYHMTSLQSQGIPVAVYAYANGHSVKEMQAEAKAFYERAHAYQPTFWWIDVETSSMKNMNEGVEAFRAELKKLGAKRVGIYSRESYLKEASINTDKFDAKWLAFYGMKNDGSYTAITGTATKGLAMQQYTDQGKLAGYTAGTLDLNRVTSQAAYEKIFLGK